MTTLSVVAIRLTRVSIPLTMVHAGSMYVIQKTERTVIELALENGITGLGETWGTPDVYALAQRFARVLFLSRRPSLVGFRGGLLPRPLPGRHQYEVVADGRDAVLALLEVHDELGFHAEHRVRIQILSTLDE